jgi:Short C-terminal domain
VILAPAAPAQVVHQAVAAPAPDIADQLAKFAALRDQGILTAEEFAAQKAKLLGL